MDALQTTGGVRAPLSEQVFHERASSYVPASTTRLTPRVTLFRKQFSSEAGGKLLSNWQVYPTSAMGGKKPGTKECAQKVESQGRNFGEKRSCGKRGNGG